MPNSEQERVVLDSSSFKALASETRVLILKELDKKRCTASELAKALGVSVQGASEHLENLRVAGLVERVDEGRKWVYFTLTEKGKAVLHPERKRLWILLSVFMLVVASAGFLLLTQGFAGGRLSGLQGLPTSARASPVFSVQSAAVASPAFSVPAPTQQPNTGQAKALAVVPYSTNASNSTQANRTPPQFP